MSNIRLIVTSFRNRNSRFDIVTTTTIKCDNVELTKFFFELIVLNFDMFNDIMNNRNFIFINVF